MPPFPRHTRSFAYQMAFGISHVPSFGVIGDGQNIQHVPDGYSSDATGSQVGYNSIKDVRLAIEAGTHNVPFRIDQGLWDFPYSDTDTGEPSWAPAEDLFVGNYSNGQLSPFPPPVILTMRISETTANAARKRLGFSEFDLSVTAKSVIKVYKSKWILYLNTGYQETRKKTIEVPVPTMHPDGSGEVVVPIVMSNGTITTQADTFEVLQDLPLNIVADMQARHDSVKATMINWLNTVTFNMHFVAVPKVTRNGPIY